MANKLRVGVVGVRMTISDSPPSHYRNAGGLTAHRLPRCVHALFGLLLPWETARSENLSRWESVFESGFSA
jgi:hypothetical protein